MVIKSLTLKSQFQIRGRIQEVKERQRERERERETKKQSISNIQKVVDRIEMYLLQQITFKQRTKR